MSTTTDTANPPTGTVNVTDPMFGTQNGVRVEGRLEDVRIVAAAPPPAEPEPAEPEPEAPTSARWQAVLVVEGVRTTDHREIGADALTWRDLPIPIMMMAETGGFGHAGAVPAGRIESIAKVENRYEAAGTFDDTDAGREAQGFVESQTLRWVSVDLEVTASETIGDLPSLEDILFGEADADEEEPDWWDRITEGRIMGATICPFPAFPQAVIVMEGAEWPEVTPDNGLPTDIAASGGPAAPPASWFADPALPGPTHITVTPEGRIYGHLATWGQRHTSFNDRIVTPPKSSPGLPYFNTGTLRTAEGEDVRVGRLTMATGHAGTGLDWRPASEHYDHTGSIAAFVTAGQDEHGVWLAGAVPAGLTDEQLQVLRASGVSGDWRSIGGRLELVAALVVNVPGFPIPAMVASGAVPMFDGRVRAGSHDGAQVSLVAAGMLRRDPLGDVRRELLAELAALRAIVEPLRPLAVEALSRRVAPA